jgi:PadR family transcriptional regulator, regulatory protein AphA
MRSTPVLSPLELAILGLLRQAPRSGYDLRKAFAASAIGDSPGSIYPALRRLRAGGLIDAGGAGSRGKETFQLTAAGRRSLREALSRRVTEDEIRRNPDGVIFRLPFVELELGPSAAATFLSDYAELCGERAAQLRREGTAVAEHHAAVYGARARWAKGVRKK